MTSQRGFERGSGGYTPLAVASAPLQQRLSRQHATTSPTPTTSEPQDARDAHAQVQATFSALCNPLCRPQGDLSNGVTLLRVVRSVLAAVAQQPGCADLIDGIGQSPRHTTHLMRAFQLTATTTDLGPDTIGAVFYDLRLLVVNQRFTAHRAQFGTGTTVATAGTAHQRFLENLLHAALFAFWLTEPRRVDVAVMPARWWDGGDTFQAAVWRSCYSAAHQLWLPCMTLLNRMDEATKAPQAIGARAMIERLARQYNLSPQLLWSRAQALLAARDQLYVAANRDPSLTRRPYQDALDPFLARVTDEFFRSEGVEVMWRHFVAAARTPAFVALMTNETTPLDPSVVDDDDHSA